LAVLFTVSVGFAPESLRDRLVWV